MKSHAISSKSRQSIGLILLSHLGLVTLLLCLANCAGNRVVSKHASLRLDNKFKYVGKALTLGQGNIDFRPGDIPCFTLKPKTDKSDAQSAKPTNPGQTDSITCKAYPILIDTQPQAEHPIEIQ